MRLFDIKKPHLFRNIFIFLAVMGPGIITANVDNDAGGIATYSIAGAHFGYTMLWVLLPTMVALAIIQEMCSRMGVVTGKGLADLIREEFGLRITFYSMLILFFANLGNIMAEFAGVAAASEIFGISRYVMVPVGAVFVWYLVVKGTYKSVEKVFLIACLFYVSYIISGFLTKPPWQEIALNMIKPTLRWQPNFIMMLIGLVGTTIAPWMQFYQQAAVVEKGIKIEDYKYARIDVIIGSVVVIVVAFFIVIACAATLFKHGIRIHSAQEAALALRPLAGDYCSLLFAFGLFNASLFAASILPLATAYSICEGMGWEAGVDKRFKEAPQFYFLYTMLIVVGAGIILMPQIPLIPVLVLSQVLNGILLPFVLIFMLLLINNKTHMGRYVNSKPVNLIVWLVVIVMIFLSVALVFSGILHR